MTSFTIQPLYLILNLVGENLRLLKICVMKNNTVEDLFLETRSIPSFKVGQAMIGLKMDEVDVPILKYFKFLAKTIPFNAGYFLNIIPQFDQSHSFFSKTEATLPSELTLKKNRKKMLGAEIKTQLKDLKGVDIEYDVREGDRLEEMLKDIEDVDADLVMIGKKFQENNQIVFAKNIIRKIKSNALVVPEKAKLRLKKILVPIDFSSHSIEALHTAIGVAKQLIEPAKVVCLNVYEMPNFAAFNISKTREQFQHMIEEDRMEAFDAFIQSYAPEDSDRIQKVLLQKEMPWIPHYIMDYANKNEVDFIVMGAKGHSKVELLFIGSVTEKLLMINDEIPTLVVKK
jgi:nucleotide-binding universal stress UspA family protein